MKEQPSARPAAEITPVVTNVFRVRSRVKTGNPEAAGASIETLASHVSDTNGHPDYLKKGGSVPTGQEAYFIAKHTASKVAHAPVNLRRDETLKTKEQYDQAKSADYVDIANNYFKGNPIRHVVTAYVLNQILADYVDTRMFKNVIKRKFNVDGTMGPVGDGSQLIYIENNADGFGYAVLSNKTIGSGTQPVFLSGGVITKSTSTVGSASQPVYLKSGVITKLGAVGEDLKPVFVDANGTLTPTQTLLPKVAPVMQCKTDYNANPSSKTVNAGKVPTSVTPHTNDPDTMVATKLYVDNKSQSASEACRIPIGGIYTHSIPTEGEVSAADIATMLGYGTWSVFSYVGNFAVMYIRES